MFSQTVEYALRAMIYLASLDRSPVANDRIAASTGIPAGYLAKVMRHLVVAHLVDSYRGPRGGFCLASSAEAISILDVVNAVDPIRRIHRCPMDNPCHAELCPLHRRLDNALGDIESSFRNSTLAEMLEASSRATKPSPKAAAGDGAD